MFSLFLFYCDWSLIYFTDTTFPLNETPMELLISVQMRCHSTLTHTPESYHSNFPRLEQVVVVVFLRKRTSLSAVRARIDSSRFIRDGMYSLILNWKRFDQSLTRFLFFIVVQKVCVSPVLSTHPRVLTYPSSRTSGSWKNDSDCQSYPYEPWLRTTTPPPDKILRIAQHSSATHSNQRIPLKGTLKKFFDIWAICHAHSCARLFAQSVEVGT